MKFEITEDELVRLAEWKVENMKAAIAHQKETISPSDPFYDLYQECWNDNNIYSGAISGQYVYSFIPTSIGTTVKVKCLVTGNVIDLTDYNCW